jgi:hypothetical protein
MVTSPVSSSPLRRWKILMASRVWSRSWHHS